MMVKIAPDVIERIEKVLMEIRQQHQVRILYACESGSRTWEMESANSDYDVRFIYCRPMWQYLALDTPRVIYPLKLAVSQKTCHAAKRL